MLLLLSVDQSLPQYAFVIPEHLVQSVMQGLHCSPFSGHLGIKRTLQRAKEHYFWSHMYNELHDFVKHCQVCAQTKLDPNHLKAPLQATSVNEPFGFGPWIIWAPYLKQHRVTSIYWLSWTISLNGAKCFPPKIKELRR